MNGPPATSAPTARHRRQRDWLADAERLDRAVYDAIARTSTPTLDRTMRRLSTAANYSRIWLGTAAVLALGGRGAGRRAAVNGLAAVGVTSAVVNVAVKRIGRRGRPDRRGLRRAARPVEMPASLSFPSGHSASAFAFAAGVGAVLPIAAVPVHAAAGLVAYSRVHTGVHYPADVVAGSILGTVIAQLTTRALEGHLGSR